jgi:hypothetical protein
MVDGNDGVPPVPYILDRGALHAYMKIIRILNNSEPTKLIFLQSCRLIPNLPRYSRAPCAGKSWIAHELTDYMGLSLLTSQVGHSASSSSPVHEGKNLAR